MNSIKLRCYNCGNFAKQNLEYKHISSIMYDMYVDNGKLVEMNNNFLYFNYSCSTCSGMNIIGGFENEISLDKNKFKRLYPQGPNILIPEHQLPNGEQVIPQEIINTYEEIWFLRKQAPNAFANQIRRCLEMICNDKKAKGKTLYQKLNFLKEKGILPQDDELSKMIREIGNLGSHDSGFDLDIWDVELIDDFFTAIIAYIYNDPAKIKRLNSRINSSKLQHKLKKING